MNDQSGYYDTCVNSSNNRIIIVGRVERVFLKKTIPKSTKERKAKVNKENYELNLKKALTKEVNDLKDNLKEYGPKSKILLNVTQKLSKETKLKLKQLINPFEDWDKRICLGRVEHITYYKPKFVETSLNVSQKIDILPTGKYGPNDVQEEELKIYYRVILNLTNITGVKRSNYETTSSNICYWKNIHSMLIANLLPDNVTNSIKYAKKIAEVNDLMWRCNNVLKCYNSKTEMTFLNKDVISEVINVVKSTRNKEGMYEGLDFNGFRYIIEVDKIRNLVDMLDIDTLVNKYTHKLYDIIHFKHNKLDRYLLKSLIRSSMWKLFHSYPDLITSLKEIGYDNIKLYLQSIPVEQHNFFYVSEYLEVIAECLD